VAGKNILIAASLAIITVSQLVLGMLMVVLAAKKGGKAVLCPWIRRAVFIHSAFIAQVLPPLPFDAYRLCIFVRHRHLEVVYTTISLCYGTWESR
jgi:hypothetical protein